MTNKFISLDEAVKRMVDAVEEIADGREELLLALVSVLSNKLFIGPMEVHDDE
jgi:hypothetical protein